MVLALRTSYLTNIQRFLKKSNYEEPKDLELEAEISSLKKALRNDFIIKKYLIYENINFAVNR